MAAVPLGTGCYERLSNVPLRLVNMSFEQDPTNTQDQVSLFSRPGLTELISQGSSPIRGLLRQDGALGGLIFFVTGTTLYKANQDGTGVTSVGTIAGSDRVVMAANGSILLIATGTTLYSSNGTTVSTVSFPDGANVSSVAILNGYFLAQRADSQRVYFSAINAATFGALDYFSASTQPDDLVNIAVFGDELWMFGQSSVEIYVPSGDATLPFLRVNGRMFQMGCASRDGVARLDDGIAWVGQDRVVYHTGSAPLRFSTETIEQWLSEHPTDDIYAWSYTVEGRITYVLTCAGKTFAFSMGKWTEFAGFGLDYLGVWGSARLTNGQAIVGDRSTGKIWKLAPESTLDGTSTMICEFSGEMEVYGNPLACYSVVLDCTVGIGEPGDPSDLTDYPTISMAVSNDRGKTWQPWRTTYLGAEGVFSKAVAWSGAVVTGGLMRRPGRAFKWRTAPPARFTVRKASLNESIR